MHLLPAMDRHIAKEYHNNAAIDALRCKLPMITLEKCRVAADMRYKGDYMDCTNPCSIARGH